MLSDSLGDTKQQLVVNLAGFFALSDKSVVSFNNCELAHNVTSHKFTVTSFFDLNTAKHLTHDDFKVLVSNVLTLTLQRYARFRS